MVDGLDVIQNVALSDEQVLPAVVIEVFQAGAPAGTAGAKCTEADFETLIAERAFAIVVVEPIDFSGQLGNDDVEMAVVIEVEETGRDGPAAACDSCFGGNVGESSVAIIVIKDVLPVARNEEIGVAVIVVVADRDAHAVVASASVGKARGFRHVRETAVFVLAIEAIPVAWVGTIKFLWKPHRAGHAPAIYQKNVEQAIVIVVEQGHAARHRFNEVFL